MAKKKITIRNSGSFLEVKLKNGYVTQDEIIVEIGNKDSERKFYDWVVTKLNIDFNRYKSEKEDIYY